MSGGFCTFAPPLNTFLQTDLAVISVPSMVGQVFELVVDQKIEHEMLSWVDKQGNWNQLGIQYLF